jgi:hypothetical protein
MRIGDTSARRRRRDIDLEANQLGCNSVARSSLRPAILDCDPLSNQV